MTTSHRATKLAMIDPLGGYGIGTYTHELAQALCASGIRVDLVSPGRPIELNELPRDYSLYPIIGSSATKAWIARQVNKIHSRQNSCRAREVDTFSTGQRLGKESKESWFSTAKGTVRSVLAPVELGLFLSVRHYDCIWTQWPEMYGPLFWKYLDLLPKPLIHTVHNILPHDYTGNHSDDVARQYQRCYSVADYLVVHSSQAAEQLEQSFPSTGGKIVKSRHGMYTVYPRNPGSRSRMRKKLSIQDDQAVLLFFGGVRPYKNIDAVLEALVCFDESRVVLVVAGSESGYNHRSSDDPLGRTRDLSSRLGIEDQIRLLPGLRSYREASYLFEAADIVLLPYRESYGSGLLLLAMTFEKYILATDVGGMKEYISGYPASSLLNDASTDAVKAGIRTALNDIANQPTRTQPDNFKWNTIIQTLLPKLGLRSQSS